MDMRQRECERLHVKKVFCPSGTDPVAAGIEVVPVKHIRELYGHLAG
jgi:hypothetical protein